jgi:aspartate kinase
VQKTDLARSQHLIEDVARELGAHVNYDADIAKVSIVGLGMRSHAGVASKLFQLLADEGINIEAISTSEIKVSCVINSKYTELSVRALHDGFKLDREPSER